jgi:DNA-binding transcriptional LysR family regulator
MISMFGENAPKMIQEMKKSVDLTLFAAQPFLLIRRGNYLRDIENQIFKKYEINYKMKFEESFADILMLLAGQDMGVTFLPQMIMAMQPQYFDYAGENTLHAFPFTDLEHNIRVVAAYHSDRYIPRVSRALIAILREECQNAVEAFTKRSQMDSADTVVCPS